jgi:hypothetical protein
VSQNAFIERLGSDFDLSRMLVVDFMHEVELGVWKALFVHLIRILYAAAPNGRLVSELDKRYVARLLRIGLKLICHRFRQVPQFGQTIRCFSNNVSELKKLAARDYEDLLQVRTFLSQSNFSLYSWARTVFYTRIRRTPR